MKNVFSQSNISDQWHSDPVISASLAIDLYNASICGHCLGCPIANLSFLGPSDSIEKRAICFAYKKHGLSFTCSSGLFVSMDIAVSAIPGWKKYEGKWSHKGDLLEISGRTLEEVVRSILGMPSRSWNDGTEKCYIYINGNLETRFVWSVEGMLKLISFELDIKERAEGSRLDK